MQKMWLQPAGAEKPIEVAYERGMETGDDCYTFHCGERRHEVEVQFVDDGHGFLRIAGRIVPFHTVARKGAVKVWTGGACHSLEIVDRSARRGSAIASVVAPARDVTAAMPGTILKIEVSVGDSFQAHQPLIIMESMKMEMTLSMPQPGRAKEILCRVGQLVEMGTLLIKMEE